MQHLFKSRRSADTGQDIDLTPMLDVVFIMLIFFIVTASFVRESGIELNKEQAAQNQSDDNQVQDIVFRVTGSNEIWLNDRRIELRSVRANVERLHAENPKGRVVIRTSEQALTETFVAIADASREAGVYRIGFTLVKD
jgi:biopolymer transport protein ExbD